MNFSCAQKAKIVFKSIHQITLSISLWFVVCDFRAVLLGSAKISIFPKHTHFTFPFFGSSQEKRDWVSMWGITYSSEDAKQFFSLLKSARPMTSFLFLTVSKNRKLKSCVFYFLYPFAKQQWIKHSKITRHIYVWIVLGGLSHCIVWKVCVRFRASRHTQHQFRPTTFKKWVSIP